jgi:4-amino-4-deoxy-L-arabinose transferase-like glycosyltransferase
VSLRWITAGVLLVISTALVLWLQRDVGLARDEVVYMNAGSKYADWWTSPEISEEGITAAWGGDQPTDNNREHPPLMKTLFGFSEKVLHDQLGVASEQTGYRAPTALMWGILVALVFLWTAAVWGYAEGVIAAALVLLLPRGLFHAGLACFDAPITTLWFAAAIAYWKALDGRRRWGALAGVAFGLALATKHNAIILPALVLAHFLWVVVRVERVDSLEAARRLDRLMIRRVQSLALMFVIGPLVLVALWPWLWLAPMKHTGQWISFHLEHVHYNFEYLGRNWNHQPFPWHVAIVTTLFTVPVATLAASLLGGGVLAVRARRGEAADAARAPAHLLLLGAGAAMGPFFLGSTPIFGAEKHWAPAIPFLCVAAGVGVAWAARQAAAALAERLAGLAERRRAASIAALVLVGGVVVAASAVEARASHPYGLTHYNALAGGAAGGADLGMNRQFWGVSARGVLPWLATQPPGKVYSHDASPAWGRYLRWKMLPRGFGDSGHESRKGIESSDYAIVIHEKHFNRHDYLIWAAYGTVQPAFVLRAGGVPVVSVYRRPK